MCCERGFGGWVQQRASCPCSCVSRFQRLITWRTRQCTVGRSHCRPCDGVNMAQSISWLLLNRDRNATPSVIRHRRRTISSFVDQPAIKIYAKRVYEWLAVLSQLIHCSRPIPQNRARERRFFRVPIYGCGRKMDDCEYKIGKKLPEIFLGWNWIL